MRTPIWGRLDPSLPRFLAVGVTNTLISFGVFMGMLRILGGVPQRAAIAQATAYAAAIVWSFAWNRRWTFGVDGPWARRFARFVALQLVLLVLSAGALHLTVDLAKIPPAPAWVSVMAVVTCINYVGQRRFVFGRGEPARIAAPGPADFLAGVAIVLTAAGFGLSYGVDDQNTYLLHALMRMRPSALPGDWLAHETLLYHGTWAWSLLVTTCLAWKPASLAILNGLCSVTILWVIRRILWSVSRELRLAALFLLLGFLLTLHSESVGQSRLFCHNLVPQSLSAGLLVGAIILFMRGSYGWSGILQAGAGYLHAHFLFLGPAMMGVAHLLLPRAAGPRSWRARSFDLVRQTGPGLLVLAIRLPGLLAISVGPEAAVGRRIVVEIRSPHHYFASSYMPDFLLLLGWMMIGVAGFAGLIDREHPAVRRLAAVQGSILVFLGASFVAIVILGSQSVALLYPWRLAPFVVLISQVAAAGAFARCLGSASPSRRRLAVMAVAYAIGSALILGFLCHRDQRVSKPVLLEALLLGTLGGLPLLRGLFGRRAFFRRPGPPALATGLVLCVCLFGNRHYLRSHSSILDPWYRETRRELVAWARTTPVVARFLIPPDLEEFRLAAERPIVVDWKNAPLDPAGAIEWHRRVRVITGGGAAGSLREARRDYGALGLDSLYAIGRRFDCTYVVQRIAGTEASEDDGPDTRESAVVGLLRPANEGDRLHVSEEFRDGAVYANSEFRVYLLGPASVGPGGR